MTGWVYHRESPLQVYGPKGTENFVDSTIKAYKEDISVRSQAPENLDIKGLQTNIETIYDGFEYQDNGLTIEAFAVKHKPFSHAFGFKIYNGKYCVVISGCLLYTSPSPRDLSTSRMPSSA